MATPNTNKQGIVTPLLTYILLLLVTIGITFYISYYNNMVCNTVVSEIPSLGGCNPIWSTILLQTGISFIVFNCIYIIYYILTKNIKNKQHFKIITNGFKKVPFPITIFGWIISITYIITFLLFFYFLSIQNVQLWLLTVIIISINTVVLIFARLNASDK